jgi:sterol desaturase/sphingolipid hydroxylase (fatty acid hydroxylase superfamily)
MFAELVNTIEHRLSHVDLVTPGLILLTALISALIAYWRTVEQKSFRDFFDFVFPKEIVLHPSARADALFWITKRLIMPILFLPAGATFVAAVGYATNQVVGGLLHIDAPVMGGPAGPVTIVIFTATMLLAYDLSYYLYHAAQHRFPVLWELHKVHHSAEVLVGITKDRVHPLDDLMNRIWDGVIPGICFGIWTLIALDPVEVTIFGFNVYVVRNILMMDFVRHTHFKISFGPLNNVILCPHWHQLHHSVDPRHYDKNFGLLFSFWDRLFGTLVVPEPDEDFKFGLMDRDVRDYQSLFGLWVLPLQKMGRIIGRWFRRPQDKVVQQQTGSES